MVTVVPDFTPSRSWVQAIGAIAFHHADGTSKRLSGSGQRLLAVLVAAGQRGASAERIAEEIWGASQPNPWRPALRMAVARLRKQLPERWDIVASAGAYSIAPDDGWVDAWQLEILAESDEAVAESDLSWTLAGRPFAEMDSLGLVHASAQHLQMLQIMIVQSYCAQEPKVISTATCGLLAGFVRDHPYNAALALEVAQTLDAADRGTEAILALSAFAETYAAEFGAIPADIERFLLADADREPTKGADDQSRADPARFAPTIARELRPLLEVPLIGRQAALAALRESQGALLVGATGVGKSRLLAELVANTAHFETTYVVGDDRRQVPLGPFAAALPDVRDDLLSQEPSASGRGAGPNERPAATRAWRLVLGHLEAKSSSREQQLIVDDAHLLDPASLALLRLLILSNTNAPLTFVVCGRSDVDDPEWIELMRDATRSGLDLIEVPGLDLEGLEEMVFDEFPAATVHARTGLAQDVLEASDGLPVVASTLIALADPDTLALPDQLVGASALGRVPATVPPDSAGVVAAAAVLGQQFSIGALISLTGGDEAAVFHALDDLWTRRLIVETEDPDQLRFRHLLVQGAFLETMPLFQRSLLHSRAAELATDPHERADHCAHAGALIPADVSFDALIASARLYAEKGMWRKVTREFRRIDDLVSIELDAEALILRAVALDSSGADGANYRSAAFDLASTSGQWETALEAALSGLPIAERPDGDPTRTAMLQAIPPDQLRPNSQFELYCNLSRQLSLASRFGEGMELAQQAQQCASDPDQVGRTHTLLWVATRHPDTVTHWVPDEVLAEVSPSIGCGLLQLRALTLAEAGDFASARIEADRFLELAVQVTDAPVRVWHAQALQGLFLINDGEFAAAESLALETHEFALAHGIQQGPVAFFGLQVFMYDTLGRLDELVPRIEHLRSDLETFTLGRAALILVDHETGDDITNRLRQLVEEVRERDDSLATLCRLIFAHLVREHTPDLADETRRMLERFGDDPIVGGIGAASFGPALRYVAQLASDPDEKRDLLERAVAAADRHGALLWRIQTRLDCAEAGEKNALDEARSLAKGTELAEFVERRAARLG